MVMIWRNFKMAWSDKIAVKKGDLGEKLVDEYIFSLNYVPYKSTLNAPHAVDRICISFDKQNMFLAEVKTKAKRNYYPDTGFDIRHYKEYKHLQDEYKMKLFIFFVDENEKMIYGNFLNIIDEPVTINYKNKLLEYPIKDKGIIYFPIKKMRIISKDLSDGVTNKLKELSERNYEYITKGGK